ncbi:MAG: TlpA family protein disulfide reductase [Verrucomicrobia bacterium]|nr:TlpA family protein disulfide reductase [Verrucomicrobiota bacterium]
MNNAAEQAPIPSTIPRRRTAGLLLAALGFLAGGCAVPETGGPKRVTLISTPAQIVLPTPTNTADRAYLGLPGSATTFTLDEAQAEVLIVDLFDMYCHVCQTEAPRMRQLVQEVQTRGLAGRVKFLGLGVGDTPLEAATFRREFQMPFPVFPDRKRTLARALGSDLKLPGLIALRKRNGRWQAVCRCVGLPRDMSQLLDHLLTLAAPAGPASNVDVFQDQLPSCDGSGHACPNPARSSAATSGQSRSAGVW